MEKISSSDDSGTSMDSEWSQLLQLISADYAEVKGRAQPLDENEREIIRQFAEKRIESNRRQEAIRLLASNSTALEFLASLIKAEATQGPPSTSSGSCS